jgi:hypothetical protein
LRGINHVLIIGNAARFRVLVLHYTSVRFDCYSTILPFRVHHAAVDFIAGFAE